MGNMDEKFEESVMKLAGLVSSLQSRVQALEDLCLLLAKNQGLDPVTIDKALKQLAKDSDEKALLQIGDTHPRAADLADVLKRLKDQKEGEASGDD